jgi:all-trans-retinol 13,14-reductase
MWKKHPGRENKSTCIAFSFIDYDKFKKWDSKTLRNRGDDYDELKNAIGDNILDSICKLYPKMKHHIDYMEVSSPVTVNHYLGQQNGGTYSLDFGGSRMTALSQAKMRAKTDVKGTVLPNCIHFL